MNKATGQRNVNYFGSDGLSIIAQWYGRIPKQEREDHAFPPPWTGTSPERQKTRESANAYFIRIVDTVFAQDPLQSSIEDSLLALIRLNSKSGFIESLTVEAFIARNGTLEDAYLGESMDVLRLDYHPHQPGKLFLETVPHLHIQPGSPRIPFHVTSERSLLAAFFDFIYRNYFPERWLQWSRDIWSSAPHFQPKDDPELIFDRIFNTYNKSSQAYIRETYGAHYDRLKRALNTELNKMFPDIRRRTTEDSFLNL